MDFSTLWYINKYIFILTFIQILNKFSGKNKFTKINSVKRLITKAIIALLFFIKAKQELVSKIINRRSMDSFFV